MDSVSSANIDALLPVIVFVWLAGVTMLLVRMAGGLWHVRRLQILSLAAFPSRWQAAAQRIASGLGLRTAVHVVESVLVETPATVGWLRPVILLPIAALANLTPSQVEAILAHELIHIRRHDYLVNVAQTVAETLLFFHPGVWRSRGLCDRSR
jgi:beta-lactamase regulating signal transducer with metallopeptidase domain